MANKKQQERIQGQGGANLTALVIDRRIWLRGHGGKSALLTDAGTRCCLGILGQACGIPDYAMLHQGEPECVSDLYHWPQWIIESAYDRRQTTAVLDLIAINDNPRISEPVREKAVARIFAEHGVAVTFTDGTP